MSANSEATGCVLSYLSVQGATAVETVAAAGAAGFSAVTIRAMPTGALAASADAVAAMATPAATRAAADASGVEIADVEYVNLSPDWTPDRSRAVVEVGAELGASVVTTMGTDPDEVRLTESFGRLCEISAEAGLCAALEFSAYTEVQTLAKAVRIATAVGGPAAAVVIDALHLARSGGSPADVAAAAASTPELFRCLHLCDGPAALERPSAARLAEESRTDRLLPGDGELPLEALAEALPEARRYVEAPVRASAAAGFRERAEAAAWSVQRFAPTVAHGGHL